MVYTAISFAPVQGFIEKSRKLRDLYGASLILSYLSRQLVNKAENELHLKVISPGLPNIEKGMPNRILIKGKFERNDVQNTLLGQWQRILKICRVWIEDHLGIPKNQYYWSDSEKANSKNTGEWEHWGNYTWEIFWGWGESVQAAMDDLETRKLKRDWIGMNWIGESSSLTGTDAIAWHKLGQPNTQPGRLLTPSEQNELELFYRRLSWLLDNPNERVRKSSLSLEQLRNYEQDNPDQVGRYIAPNERLSIPELVKRLVTYDKIADQIGMTKLKKKPDDPEFKDINREAGYWTGWFMGDGDKVGDKLRTLARDPNNSGKQDDQIQEFSDLIRNWGQNFGNQQNLFPPGKARVIYAGGDDFLGVLYSEETQNSEKPAKIKPIDTFDWLLTLPNYWQNLQQEIQDKLSLDFNFSVGFVWAGHQVPQRDILQHCREAEKRAKSLGRNRVTIRVVFNSGQYVQWTCPWDHLDILNKYCDRDKKTGKQANWNHIYNDWNQLKSRHAIRLKNMENLEVNNEMALALFNLYFNKQGENFKQERKWSELTGDNTDLAIVNWINDLILVGWQLCRNSNI